MGYRVFVDSGPVLEKALARKAGIGWIGKHTNLIARDAGSYFFIGEILTDLPLPVDEPASAHCGTCSACIPACPTGAITAPYQLDARRCISYLTIELHGAIPVELRRLIGIRIYGCDDCQLVCPWNKFARAAAHPDFKMRHGLDAARLAELFAWTEEEFLARTEGSAIRRIGYERWLRNIAVALGNAPATRRRTSPPRMRGATIRQRWCASTSTWALGELAQRSVRACRLGVELQVVDEPRLAEARRGQHHEVPRVGLRRRQRARVAHAEVVGAEARRLAARRARRPRQRAKSRTPASSAATACCNWR